MALFATGNPDAGSRMEPVGSNHPQVHLIVRKAKYCLLPINPF